MDKSLILNRIKKANNLTTDKELADYLGISKSTLSNWYTRNSIDYDLVFSKCEHISKDWLITGKGEILKKKDIFVEMSETAKAISEMEEIPHNPLDIDMINMLSEAGEKLERENETLKSMIKEKDSEIERLKIKVEAISELFRELKK